MFRFRKNKTGSPFWHGKLFTVEWELPGCKWVLVHYKNGERKPWYKRTERPYRFRRWFLKKGSDRFSNLANVDSPQVVIYVFRWYVAWPERKVLPMDVRRLSVPATEVRVFRPEVNCSVTGISLHVEVPEKTLSSPPSPVPAPFVLRLHPSVPALPSFDFPVMDWPVSEWVRNDRVRDGDLTFTQLEKIHKSN
ncbi:MAG: hypothetical protein RL213_1933 [Bacteroidota bacterium]